MNILVIDDDKDCCDALEDFIKMIPDCNVLKAYSGLNGLTITKNHNIDLIFSDINMPELNGFELIELIKSHNYDTEIVLISGKQDIVNSINSIELGIYDFLTKPVDIYKIKEIIDNIINKKNNKKILDKLDIDNIIKLNNKDLIVLDSYKNLFKQQKESGFMLFSTKKMNSIYQKLKKLKDFTEIPVLIEGETGVGKEVAARYMHYQSNRKDYPFIGINCAAINRDIFESEFFGYEKGAFTGANPEGSEGYIKASEKGTLFLDEISEIPLNLQAKLLRVLEENEYYRVGGSERLNVNTRIIFATNRNLEDLINTGMFREDLYYRINVCKITIPPLRKRTDEIIPLSLYFINEINEKVNNKIKKIEAGFLKKLLDNKWHGNIRELKNLLTNIALFNEGNILKENVLNIKKNIIENNKNTVLPVKDFILPDASFDLEKLMNEIVKKALIKFNGNKTKAANYLNLTRIQLYKRFKDVSNDTD